MKRFSCWVTATAVLGLSTLAHAQTGSDVRVEGTGATYSVHFVDDPLNALGQDSLIPRIVVRPRAPRTTLIRPRIDFVTELLKSESAF